MDGWSDYHVLVPGLSALYASSLDLALTTIQWGQSLYFLDFIDEDTEVRVTMN